MLAALRWAFFQPAEAYSVVPSSRLIFVFWFLVWQIVKREGAPALSVLLLSGALIGFAAMGIARGEDFLKGAA